MNFSAIHHVAIIVSDYEVSREFYVERLGFEVVRENWRPEKRDWKLDLRVNPTTELEIFAPENPPARPSYPEACGLRHLAFRVSDIEAAVAQLAERGIECEPVRTDDFTGERMTFFSDPDGLPLELHE
ncbi:SMU1112c/YaeR family gloxylase I-like metalloprotein [Olsenella intestinalis]|uniref:SMU1112c/YaeR family gloxylase I-like metalloprotein n=1 Tax=Olsenella intestinalis TaxID=2930083 RepID=UPI00200DD3DC|nr:VOC family protein [Olsenella intestinalis]